MSEPCPRCAVRSDLGCEHQPASGSPPPAIASPGCPKDGRRKANNNSLAYHATRPRDGGQ